MKKILIDQPGYLGDIIFIMAITQKFSNLGYKVIIPVPDEYIEYPSIQKYFPAIKFVSNKKDPIPSKYIDVILPFEDDEYIYLPLGKSPISGGTQHMKHKYEMCLKLAKIFTNK